jgi:S1-C subfamily serine protease
MGRKSAVLLVLLVLIPLVVFAVDFETAFSDLFLKTNDSVVSISVTNPPATPSDTSFIARGAGFIWTSDGYIVSAAHLFDTSKNITVFIRKRSYLARLIGKDDQTDIALIKIDGTTPLKPVQVGDSDTLKIGEWVAAIGDPFGLRLTFTHGIVSGKERRVNNFLDEFIQNDAPINPGNSGGPLFNLKGEVVGMNTLKIDGDNTSFSVPINLIKIIIPILLQKGKVTRAWLGADIQNAAELTDKEMQKLKPSSEAVDKNRVIVVRVATNSPAAKAGLREADIIRAYNNKNTNDALEFSRFINYQPIGQAVSLLIERDKKLYNVIAILSSYPE